MTEYETEKLISHLINIASQAALGQLVTEQEFNSKADPDSPEAAIHRVCQKLLAELAEVIKKPKSQKKKRS